MSELQGFKDMMAKSLYGISAQKAISLGICIQCKELALPKCYSDAGRAEYYISGLCEKCFDSIFEG